MGIHCRDDEVVLQFGLEKPVARLIVNGPTTQGAVGLSTGLDPSMTLGCGTHGGNITSDNIGPRHLINVRRVAFPRASYFDEVGVPFDPASTRTSGESGAPSSAPGPSPNPAEMDPTRVMIDRAMIGARLPASRDLYRDDAFSRS